MKKAKGFTLVELLVVIGIIALLISILLPSLNRARWQAKVVACSARMHDLLLAATMYANDNKGYLPPYAGDDGKPLFDLQGTPHYSSSFNAVYQAAFLSNTVFNVDKDDGANLGRLWKTKYLKTWNTFYCPDIKSPPAQKAVPDARNFGYYTFNPHYKYVDSAATVLQVWWKKLPGYGRIPMPTLTYVDQQSFTAASKTIPYWRRALIVEPFWASSASDVQNITHTVGKRRAFNMGYPDGSVQAYYTDSWAARPVDRWVRFLDISNALQHAADGGDVVWTGNWQNNYYNAIPVMPN